MDQGENRLFEQIPENLFSILAGPLREVHADLLFIIYEQYRRTIHTLPRELIIDLFCEYLETAGDHAWNNLEQEETPSLEDEEGLAARAPRERAFQLLRKLVEAEWLIQEQGFDYTFKITVPDYALALLETLDKIRTGYRMEFRGRVLAVYHNLTGEEAVTYVALQQAHESTAELIDGLKRLSHSIKKYTDKLLQKKEPREIISQIFDEYQPEILGEQYYRLKTSEHISKYRTGILARVKEWQADRNAIIEQARRMVEERQAASRLEGENRIYDWLEYIEESFRSMDEILEEIDRRNAQYARAAVEKLRFQLNRGRGVEQALAAALYHLARFARLQGEREEAGPEIARVIKLFPLRYIDELSVKTPPRGRKVHRPVLLEEAAVAPGIRGAKLERFRQRVREEITVEEINRYVQEQLGDRAGLPLGELPLQTGEQWVRLIYILLYSRSRRSLYSLAGERGQTVSLRGGAVELPGLTLQRKDA